MSEFQDFKAKLEESIFGYSEKDAPRLGFPRVQRLDDGFEHLVAAI
jgi:hypothetical protein